MKTFEIVTAQGTQYVCASSKKGASLKITGLSPKAAMAMRQIVSIKRVE